LSRKPSIQGSINRFNSIDYNREPTFLHNNIHNPATPTNFIQRSTTPDANRATNRATTPTYSQRTTSPSFYEHEAMPTYTQTRRSIPHESHQATTPTFNRQAPISPSFSLQAHSPAFTQIELAASPVFSERETSPLVENRVALISAPAKADFISHLTVSTTQQLQTSANIYMQNQESILAALKSAQKRLKKLDEEMQENMEILQKNVKHAQEALQKEMQSNTKALKEDMDDKKRQLQKRMETLSELNQEAQKRYFQAQEKNISHYKKTVQKAL